MKSTLGLTRMRRIAYVGAPGIAAIAIAVLTAAEGETVFSPGELSVGHAGLSEDCKRCHLGSERAMNAGCLDCHRFRIGADRIESHALHGKDTHPPACASCHPEHGRTSSDHDACGECHGTLQPAIASLAVHPEIEKPNDPGTIEFNHTVHMRTDPSCDACHRTVERGDYQAPIQYADHCASCHPLDVPHAEASVGNAGCPKCHHGAKEKIAPAAIRARWLLGTRFDHSKHRPIAECTSCHSSILGNSANEQVSIPDLGMCRQCHESSPCTTCHTFHVAAGPEKVSYDPKLVEDGKIETRTGMRRSTALWPRSAFFELPRAVWNKPEVTPGTPEFEREVFSRYGLFPADYENDGLPLGLIGTERKFEEEEGLSVTCELCHSSMLFGKMVIGQPNRFSNFEQLWIDLDLAAGTTQENSLWIRDPRAGPINTVINAADQLALIGLMVRKPGLEVDLIEGWRFLHGVATHLKEEVDEVAYLKTPPWYTYRTKLSGSAGYYFDGGFPKEGNFAAFTYLPSFFQDDGADIRAALADWQRSGHAYLATIEPPPYPFAIDREKAARGALDYERLCARCHGKPGAYPGMIVSIDEVKTDPLRAHFPPRFVQRMRSVLRLDYRPSLGYVAAPLEAIWAQAPYLHNGSVPTMMQLLDPPRRVARFALTADPNVEQDFDQVEMGWKIDPSPSPNAPRLIDAALVPGLDNRGHTYGEELSPEARADLIEYLKTF